MLLYVPDASLHSLAITESYWDPEKLEVGMTHRNLRG